MRAQRYLVLSGAQVAVGAAAIFARFALTGAAPLAVSACRLSIAAGVLLAASLFSRHGESDGHSEESKGPPIFGFAGLALALHFATWIWSLQYTSVAISTLLVATTPVWTALYDSVARRRYLSVFAWLAMAGGGVGVFLIVGFASGKPPVAGHQALGDALALIGAMAIGAYFLLIREVRSAYGTQAIVTRTYSWAALALILAAAAARQPPPAISDAPAWGGIVAMALISQLLGHTGMNAALRWFSPSAVAFSTLVEPVIAAVLALFIFGEQLTAAAIVGALLVLGSIAVFLRHDSSS